MGIWGGIHESEAKVAENGFSLNSFLAVARVVKCRGRGQGHFVFGSILENRVGGGIWQWNVGKKLLDSRARWYDLLNILMTRRDEGIEFEASISDLSDTIRCLRISIVDPPRCGVRNVSDDVHFEICTSRVLPR